MITRDLTITVNNNTASLNEPVTIYRGDRGIILSCKIMQYKFKFKRSTLENVINNETSIIGARVLVRKPNGSCFEIPYAEVTNDTVDITIMSFWADELSEIGTYKLQIQLYGEDPVKQRITIPPVEFKVEDLLCDIKESYWGSERVTDFEISGGNELKVSYGNTKDSFYVSPIPYSYAGPLNFEVTGNNLNLYYGVNYEREDLGYRIDVHIDPQSMDGNIHQLDVAETYSGAMHKVSVYTQQTYNLTVNYKPSDNDIEYDYLKLISATDTDDSTDEYIVNWYSEGDSDGVTDEFGYILSTVSLKPDTYILEFYKDNLLVGRYAETLTVNFNMEIWINDTDLEYSLYRRD